jgi:hypothetical protein
LCATCITKARRWLAYWQCIGTHNKTYTSNGVQHYTSVEGPTNPPEDPPSNHTRLTPVNDYN